MKFVLYNYKKWQKNVLLFLKKWWWNQIHEEENLKRISEFNWINLYVFDVLDEKLFGEKTYYMYPKEFVSYYMENRSHYDAFYSSIIDFCKNKKINLILFLWNVIPYWWAEKYSHFLMRLKEISKIACYFADDDVITVAERISKPYVKLFDYSFCAAIYYKCNKVMLKDMYSERGCKNTDYIPLWLNYGSFNEWSNLDFFNRHIDILYVWWCYGLKILRLFRLKKYFWEKMLIYGKWWMKSNSLIKTFILKILRRYYNVWDIYPLDESEFIKVYESAKIWFNLHQDYWPTNVRMYELPANWCMQICDNPLGLSKLFALDKEVVWYSSIDEAIQKIEYYLENDEERRKIAEAWYKKVMKSYRIELCYKKLFDIVFNV